MGRTIDSKLPDVGTTIFTVMSQLAAETGAINLSRAIRVSIRQKTSQSELSGT